MMLLWMTVAMTGVGGMPMAGISAAVPPAAIRADDVATRGLELAVLLNSDAVTRVQLRKLLEETFPEQFAKDPSFITLEKEYPGITREAITAMTPVMTEWMVAELPAMQREIAGVYARRFNAAELAELLQFYRSPTGQRVVDLMSKGVDYSQMVGSVVKSGGEGAVTQQDFVASVDTGVAVMMKSMTASEKADMVRFGSSPTGLKLRGVNEEVQRLAVEMANRPRPDMEKKVEAAVMAAMARRMGTTPADAGAE